MDSPIAEADWDRFYNEAYSAGYSTAKAGKPMKLRPIPERAGVTYTQAETCKYRRGLPFNRRCVHPKGDLYCHPPCCPAAKELTGADLRKK